MANDRSIGKRWEAYRPSKVIWFWSTAACVLATVIVGFAWGGWVTGGTATQMAASAATEARARLVAAVCVSRFQNSDDAAAQFAALEKAPQYQRQGLIEAKGWTIVAGTKEPVVGAADLCAERILKAGLPASNG